MPNELTQAESEQAPSLRQYKSVQQRLEQMEQQHSHQVSLLQANIEGLERGRVQVVVADEHLARRCREQIMHKNTQIERFQSELDSIIGLCVELQAHGILLPKTRIT